MCGRYYSLFDKQQVAEHFHVRRTADNVGLIAPNYNVAPGDTPFPGTTKLSLDRWSARSNFSSLLMAHGSPWKADDNHHLAVCNPSTSRSY
jgi:putative SOS response-associated peptidase YedK